MKSFLRSCKFVLDGLYRFILLFIAGIVICYWEWYFLWMRATEIPEIYLKAWSFGNAVIFSSFFAVLFFMFSLLLYPIRHEKWNDFVENKNGNS